MKIQCDRILIGVEGRVLELTLAGAHLVRSRLCRTHVFPPPSRPGEDILVRRPTRRTARPT
jgi:hypothetical protein